MSEAETAQRQEVAAKLSKSSKNLEADTKNFLARLDSWLKPEPTKATPLQTPNDVRAELGVLEKQTNADVTTLRQDNAKLRGEIKGLTGLVAELGARLVALEGKSPDAAPQQETNAAGGATDLSRIEKMEATIAGQGVIVAKVETVDFASLNDFMANGKPRQQELLDKQENAVTTLREQMSTLQADLQAAAAAHTELKEQQQQQRVDFEAGLASVLASAPAAAPAPTPTPTVSIPSAPLLFPGDDIPSLRMDISELNEKTDKLEARYRGAINAIAKNTIDVKKLQDELQKDRLSWTSMSTTFGHLLDQETRDRLADSGRLAELGLVVRQLQELPTASFWPTGTEVAKIGTGSRASPAQVVPNTDNSTDSLGMQLGVSPATPTVLQTLPPQNPLMESDNSRQGGLSPQVLEPALQPLQAQIKSVENDLQALRVSCFDQLSSLRMMVTTLDTQINNITTRELFQAIVGHLERLFPSSRQMQQDIKSMARAVEGVTQQLNGLKQSSPLADKPLQIKDNKGSAATSSKRALGEAPNDGNAEVSASAKRQRVDVARQPSNGSPATSDPANESGNRPAASTVSTPALKTPVPKSGLS
ncbi:hypothetical protein SEPCBS119000_001265 [Sporothrix epigloea]|uniref:Uncharacterized protein n=1 Tax=Sporothrix epigloea TaxID=1892477 RepID=A0ABP0DBF3_9PEZI